MSRSAKIVATIGPSSSEADMILKLLRAGVNIARLNFSHGTHEDHAAVVSKLRSAAQSLGRTVTILQDLQGPKIRIGQIANGQVEICAGQSLTLTTSPIQGNSQVVPVDFPQILEGIKPGGRILLDDGNLELEATSIQANQVTTRVVLGGVLKSHKGINLPGARLNIPGFTSKDEADLAFGLETGVDTVAVSFVRSASDIKLVRSAIQRLSPQREHIPIIAKLERPESLENLEDILNVSDGVMVARGDLGVEMAPESVPIAQKRIISAANQCGKVVITATQMLDSMITNPRPTRAEASDVANAIFDGTDAVMLSGETASGKYPLQAVQMMDAIILQAEEHLTQWGRWEGKITPESDSDNTYFITQAARELAHDRNVTAVAVFTRSGRTALLMSKTRPNLPILAFTPEKHSCQMMNMYWGVSPFLVPIVSSVEEMVQVVEATMLQSQVLQRGQEVVMICGFPIPNIQPTNLVLLHRLGDHF